MLRLVLDMFAPIPVGHHVTVFPLEVRTLFGIGGDWGPSRMMLVCDDTTRVVYTSRGVGEETMTYDSLGFAPDSNVRFAQRPPLRGTVRACVVRSDSGDTVHMQTVLVVEPDAAGYR